MWLKPGPALINACCIEQKPGMELDLRACVVTRDSQRSKENGLDSNSERSQFGVFKPAISHLARDRSWTQKRQEFWPEADSKA